MKFLFSEWRKIANSKWKSFKYMCKGVEKESERFWKKKHKKRKSEIFQEISRICSAFVRIIKIYDTLDMFHETLKLYTLLIHGTRVRIEKLHQKKKSIGHKKLGSPTDGTPQFDRSF